MPETPGEPGAAPHGRDEPQGAAHQPNPTAPLPREELPDWARAAPLPPLGGEPPVAPDWAAPTPMPPLEPGEPPMAGSMQRQEPGVTQPRPPTVAEVRARDKARRRAEEEAAAAEAKARTRRRRMKGAAAVAGVAAVIGAGYLIHEANKPRTVTAHCTEMQNGQEVVVPDSYCSRGHISPGMAGLILLGGHQYRYYYGGSGTIGRPPSGGSFSAPSNATVKDPSGHVIRGGFGSKSGGVHGHSGGS